MLTGVCVHGLSARSTLDPTSSSNTDLLKPSNKSNSSSEAKLTEGFTFTQTQSGDVRHHMYPSHFHLTRTYSQSQTTTLLKSTVNRRSHELKVLVSCFFNTALGANIHVLTATPRLFTEGDLTASEADGSAHSCEMEGETGTQIKIQETWVTPFFL